MMKTTLAAALFTVICSAASAQTAPVYRCGDTYSQTPCTGATRVPVTDEARPRADVARSREAALRDAKTADAMEKARLKEEAKPAQVYIPPPPAPPVADAKTKPKMAKGHKGDYFTAVDPASVGKKKSKKKKREA